MKRLVLIVLFFLFNGCSFNELLLTKELNKVHVVTYSTYLKHYRAYFVRRDLKTIRHKQKYLFLYHAKREELSLLLRHKHSYSLHNFSNPNRATVKLKTSSRKILRLLAKKGYRIADPNALGFTTRTGLRRFKGVKTLMVEIKDYRKLKDLYKKAIRQYDAKSVLSVRTTLPKQLIKHDFMSQYQHTSDPKQRAELQKIATKLHIHLSSAKKKPTQHVEESVKDSYSYYLHTASEKELHRYLNSAKSQKNLSFSQYDTLKTHLAQLEEQRLLKDGSPEELMEMYNRDKNPKYKKRIIELLKQ